MENKAITEAALSQQMTAVLTIISDCDDLTANAGKFIDASADWIEWEHIFKQRWSNEQKTALAWAFALWRDEARPRFDVFESSSAMGESLKLAVLRAIMIRWHFGTRRTDQFLQHPNQGGQEVGEHFGTQSEFPSQKRNQLNFHAPGVNF